MSVFTFFKLYKWYQIAQRITFFQTYMLCLWTFEEGVFSIMAKLTKNETLNLILRTIQFSIF